jgi:hypothetical protein
MPAGIEVCRYPDVLLKTRTLNDGCLDMGQHVASGGVEGWRAANFGRKTVWQIADVTGSFAVVVQDQGAPRQLRHGPAINMYVCPGRAKHRRSSPFYS